MYATGKTENVGFPTTAGAFDQTHNGGEDGFITKFNPAGTALVFSTFFGGTAKDQPFSIALGTDNSPFIAGETTSGQTFPLKNSLNGTSGQIFVSHLNADASALIYSTLLGQGGAYEIAVDGANAVYATGHTTSIIATPNSFQPLRGEQTSTSSSKDAFVVKLAPTDENIQTYSISGSVSDPTQFGNNQLVTVTLTGTVSRTIILPYGNGSGVLPYFFGNLPAGGNYTVTAKKIGFTTAPESVSFNNLGANQFADFTILNNQKPRGVITSPAHGTTFNAPATVNITATASDPDGDAIAKVDFVAYNSTYGSLNISTDTTAPYEATWTNIPLLGTWSLYAIPTDSKGLVGDSTPVVQINIVDPTGLSVSITNPSEGQIFQEGDYVPLAANVSSSTSILEFYDQNNTLIGRRTSAPWSTTWRVLDTGNYTITAKVYNSQGQTAISAPVHITVNPINHRISGRITGNFSGSPISGVTLNLTSPSNPNITATTVTDSGGNYLFTDLGTTPNDGVIITPSSANYSFTPEMRSLGLGYIINWDNQNFSATQETQISVALTSPTDGQTFNAPATVNLAANATSGAGTITKVQFYRGFNSAAVLIGEDTTAPFEFQWTNVAAGSYTLYARALDSTGAVKDSQLVGISVTAPPATVRLQGEIRNPNGGPMVGITVNLTGTANGNPVNQTWVTNTNGSYGFFNLPAGGSYTITPQVSDGITFTPPSASFTNVTNDVFSINFVSSAANQPPTVQINSPADGAVYTIGQAIPFNISANDADGQVVHLTVTAVSRTRAYTIGQSNNGTFIAPWQPTEPSIYTIYAEAIDNGGLRTLVQISITVNAPSPVSVGGRVVDRNSQGIEGVTMELRDYLNRQR